MFPVANYSIRGLKSSWTGNGAPLEQLNALVSAWLLEKTGRKADLGLERQTAVLRDGRQAEIIIEERSSGTGQLRVVRLLEPIENDCNFRTSVGIVGDADAIYVAARLEMANVKSVIGPTQANPRCPHVIRDIMKQPLEWFSGESRLWPEPSKYIGTDRGVRFVELIRDANRTAPVVAISQHESFFLHPSLPEGVQYDLTAAAIVATIDDEAAWQITRHLGKEWSCFGGAVRIYWPRSVGSISPLLHPLWTASRLLNECADHEAAANQLRNSLRGEVLSKTTLVSETVPIFSKIRSEAREDRIKKLETGVRSDAEWKALVADIETENTTLREQLSSLRTELSNLKTVYEWHMASSVKTESAVVKPDQETPPDSVADAVKMATEKFAGTLIFGADVQKGIKRLNSIAGPPDKVLLFLGKLSELSAELALEKDIGGTPVEWLSRNGCPSSGENKLTKQNKDSRRARTWNAGSSAGDQFFENHMKPNDSTSPDKCVRIYFDWSQTAKKMVIGWVGPHPE